MPRTPPEPTEIDAEEQQTSPRRVHDLIRSCIRRGIIKPDQQLEESNLAKTFATSRNAVREALQLLAEEGLVSRRRRHGTTVTRDIIQIPVEDVIPHVERSDMMVHRIDHRLVPTIEHIGAHLQTTDSFLGMIEHIFSIAGEPIGVRVAYYKQQYIQPEGWERCPDLRSAFPFVFGRPLGRVDTTIEASACEPRTSRLLGIPVGSPVLVREQLLVDSCGSPQEFTFSHYRADRVAFTVPPVSFQAR